MLIGYTVPLTGPQIAERLGKPRPSPCYKIDWSWTVTLPDGIDLEVYNYKDGPKYGVRSRFGDARVWHVGLMTNLYDGHYNLRLQSRLLEALCERLGLGSCTYRYHPEKPDPTSDLLPF